MNNNDIYVGVFKDDEYIRKERVSAYMTEKINYEMDYNCLCVDDSYRYTHEKYPYHMVMLTDDDGKPTDFTWEKFVAGKNKEKEEEVKIKIHTRNAIHIKL